MQGAVQGSQLAPTKPGLQVSQVLAVLQVRHLERQRSQSVAFLAYQPNEQGFTQIVPWNLKPGSQVRHLVESQVVHPVGHFWQVVVPIWK